MSSKKTKRDPNDPHDWTGTRQVIPTRPCGYCRDESHQLCNHEIAWFDKLWICGCTCNKKWKPVAVQVGHKAKDEVDDSSDQEEAE